MLLGANVSRWNRNKQNKSGNVRQDTEWRLQQWKCTARYRVAPSTASNYVLLLLRGVKLQVKFTKAKNVLPLASQKRFESRLQISGRGVIRQKSEATPPTPYPYTDTYERSGQSSRSIHFDKNCT